MLPFGHGLRDAPGVAAHITPRPIFDRVLEDMPTDRAPGVRSAGAEELQGVARAGGADAIYSIIVALNSGTMLPDVYAIIEPSLLFALRKPNGKPRPIAIGDILDTLAGRCILAVNPTTGLNGPTASWLGVSSSAPRGS